VTPEEWARVFATYGPRVPDEEELVRRRQNLDLRPRGLDVLRSVDIRDQLGRIESPTLVCVGALDPITPIAAAEEIVDALPEGVAELEVIDGVGHFPWKDAPDRYWPAIVAFVKRVG
jgi:pimeloyl-ACP methyl ester carboxylesterase